MKNKPKFDNEFIVDKNGTTTFSKMVTHLCSKCGNTMIDHLRGSVNAVEGKPYLWVPAYCENCLTGFPSDFIIKVVAK